jgi:hypothetical protein
MPKLYRTNNHPMGPSDTPDYIIRDGLLYRTIHHPGGWTENPDFELKADGKIYPYAAKSACAIYEFQNDLLVHRTAAHPLGSGCQADYAIFD